MLMRCQQYTDVENKMSALLHRLSGERVLYLSEISRPLFGISSFSFCIFCVCLLVSPFLSLFFLLLFTPLSLVFLWSYLKQSREVNHYLLAQRSTSWYKLVVLFSTQYMKSREMHWILSLCAWAFLFWLKNKWFTLHLKHLRWNVSLRCLFKGRILTTEI